MRFFIYTIFLSAFLLFQVQPMIARFILPWFGGSSAVWSTCLLFFQFGLIVGYGYSYLITRFFSTKNQVKIHLVLLLLSLISIPVAPHEWMKPQGDGNPILGILSLLSLSVGFPYVMISTTGPLLQVWFSISNPKKSPYRLYALSNFGSMIGLLSYPTIIEPYLNLKTQTWVWSVGYFLFILCCSMAAKIIWKHKTILNSPAKKKPLPIGFTNKFLWLFLACMGTITLLSISNKLTQDIAVVPFLWIIPLTLYLITFIIAFDNPRWYNRNIFLPALMISIILILRIQFEYIIKLTEISLPMTVFIYVFGVFILCMVLHGELARLKPDESNLTLYYFIISAGGVLGGIFINLIVPFIFKGYWEIYFAFIGSILIVSFLILKSDNVLKKGVRRILFFTFSIAALLGTSYALSKEYKAFYDEVLVSTRNFYGVLKVTESNKGTISWQRSLLHGNITHGIEFMDSLYNNVPISYYGPTSGMGLALSRFPTRASADYKGMKVGMIGLGAGSISAYGTDKDLYRFYEINPEVEILARKYFKYLSNYKGKQEIIIGDGRISLENEFKKNGSEQYDVFAVDAFSGDAIPAHLLTIEAAQLYFKNLKKDGILLFHITNKYLDLMPVMIGLSESLGKPFHYFFQQKNETAIEAIWVLFTDNNAFLNDPEVQKYLQEFDVSSSPKVFWTDDYSSILPLFN